MNVTFEDKDLEELILQGKNKLYKKYSKDVRFMQALGRVYSSMVNATSTSCLSNLSFLHYEKLKGIGLSSVRVMNGRIERILFKEREDGLVITIIDWDDTHYGNKK